MNLSTFIISILEKTRTSLLSWLTEEQSLSGRETLSREIRLLLAD